MTLRNAALVEQSAAAAEILREQSQQLSMAVVVFKIGDWEQESRGLVQIGMR